MKGKYGIHPACRKASLRSASFSDQRNPISFPSCNTGRGTDRPDSMILTDKHPAPL